MRVIPRCPAFAVRLLASSTTWLVLFAATAALAGTAVAGAVWNGTDAESTALRAAGGLSAVTTALVGGGATVPVGMATGYLLARAG